MSKKIEKLYLFETSDYYKMKDPLLFYDVAELGWTRFLSAHINYLTKNGKKVAVCTNPSREVIYRDFATEILPMPKSFYEKFGHLVSNGFNLYDLKEDKEFRDHNLISEPFQNTYTGYTILKEYSLFEHERIFEPYHHSKQSETFCQKFRKIIILFPRYRPGDFAKRNIPKDKWLFFINTLCKKFPNIDILTIGGKSNTLDINTSFPNYYNLVSDDDNNLDIMIALCNMGKVVTAFGTQSGIMHIATMCRAPSFIIGHREWTIHDENYTNAKIYFYNSYETPSGYYIKDYNDVIEKGIKFINENI